MSAYFVAQIQVHDPERYNAYLEGFDEVFEKFAGEVVAVDEHPIVLEGHWRFSRFVLIRFPAEEELLRWYRSSEYQRLAKIRQESSAADIVVIAGRQ